MKRTGSRNRLGGSIGQIQQGLVSASAPVGTTASILGATNVANTLFPLSSLKGFDVIAGQRCYVVSDAGFLFRVDFDAPWDATNMTFIAQKDVRDTGGINQNGISGVAITEDEDYAIIMSEHQNQLTGWLMGTPTDVATAVLQGSPIDISSIIGGTSPRDICLKIGIHLYGTHVQNDHVHHWTLNTANRLSGGITYQGATTNLRTLAYPTAGESFDRPVGVDLSPDGSKLYVGCEDTASASKAGVGQFSVTTPYYPELGITFDGWLETESAAGQVDGIKVGSVEEGKMLVQANRQVCEWEYA